MSEFSFSKLGGKYTKDEMSKYDDSFHKELQNMYKSISCEDCGRKNPNWATLKRGVFICIHCAQVLRADASNKVKNCIGSYVWHPDEMEVMRKNSQKYSSSKQQHYSNSNQVPSQQLTKTPSKTVNSQPKSVQNRVVIKPSSDCEWGDWGKEHSNNYNYNRIDPKSGISANTTNWGTWGMRQPGKDLISWDN
eukprot:Awhi_evm1s7877